MIRVITTVNKDRVSQFMDSAVNCKEVRPWLSLSAQWNTQASADSPWECTYLMNDEGTALARLSPDRSNDSRDVSVALWVLPGATQKFVAGRMLVAIISNLRSMNAVFVDAAVHASNPKSIALCTRIFGQPYGIRKCSAWDSASGFWEDAYLFRTSVSNITSNFFY